MTGKWQAERRRERALHLLDAAEESVAVGAFDRAIEQCERARTLVEQNAGSESDTQLLAEIETHRERIEATAAEPARNELYRSAEARFDEAEQALADGDYDPAIEAYREARSQYAELDEALPEDWDGIPTRTVVKRRLRLIDSTVRDLTEGKQDLPWTTPPAETRTEDRERPVPPVKLLLNLVHVGQTVGRPPTPSDVEEHGEFPVEQYFREFQSWSDALDAAGLVTRRDE